MSEFQFPVKTMLLAGTFAIGLIIGISNVHFVKPYERVVVTVGGEFSRVMNEGINVTIPFLSSTTYYDTRTQKFVTEKLNTYTVDNQEVDAVLTVQYNIPSDDKSIRRIYEEVGDPVSKMGPVIIGIWKAEAGKVNVSDIASKRGEITRELNLRVTQEIQKLYNITITDIQISDLEYQKTYRDAQNKASIVKTEIEAAEGQQKREKINAETAKIVAAGLANRAIEEARGLAESTRLQAIATAEAIRVRGQAEAASQQLMAAALTANPILVDLEKAKRWNGALPVNMYAGAPIPFLNTPVK